MQDKVAQAGYGNARGAMAVVDPPGIRVEVGEVALGRVVDGGLDLGNAGERRGCHGDGGHFVIGVYDFGLGAIGGLPRLALARSVGLNTGRGGLCGGCVRGASRHEVRVSREGRLVEVLGRVGVREGCVLNEVRCRLVENVRERRSIGAHRVDARLGLLERELHVIVVAQVHLVDPCPVGARKLARELPCPGALRARGFIGVLALAPLVGGAGRVKRGDRAPRGASRNGVRDGLSLRVVGHGADGAEIGLKERRVSRGAKNRAHAAARTKAKDKDALGVAGQGFGVIAQVANGGLEVHDRPRRSAGKELACPRRGVVTGRPATKARIDVDAPRLKIGREPVVAIRGGARLRSERAGVDRHEDGRGGRGEVAHDGLLVDRAGIRGAVLLGGEVGAGNKDGERLVGCRGGRLAVRQSQLVVDVILLVIAPRARVEGERLKLREINRGVRGDGVV